MLLQKWEDRIKHARAEQPEAQRDELSSSAPAEVAPEEAAFIALKKWAGTGRKCRQALKRANPTAIEELELHYLQFKRQVSLCKSLNVFRGLPAGMQADAGVFLNKQANFPLA